jgi:hypothetical protein
MDADKNLKDEDFLPRSPTGPAAAQIDRLLAEDDGPWLDQDDIRLQNRLLHLAVDQMRVEVFTLGHKLEEFLELNEQLNDQRQENRRLRAAMAHGLQTAAEQFSEQLRVIYASSSWRLTRPLRAIGQLLKKSKI